MPTTQIKPTNAHRNYQPVDFLFDCAGPLSFCLPLTDRATIHARNFFGKRGTLWLGCWLFEKDQAETLIRHLKVLGIYTLRVDGRSH